MVDRIETFRTKSGKSFDNEIKAWQQEFRDYIGTIDGLNNGIARLLCEKVFADPGPLSRIIDQLFTLTPPVAVPPAASTWQAAIYPIPDLEIARVRCMGTDTKQHNSHFGACTADPDYQRWIKAERMRNETMPPGTVGATLESCPYDVQQSWLHKAEQAINTEKVQ